MISFQGQGDAGKKLKITTSEKLKELIRQRKELTKQIKEGNAKRLIIDGRIALEKLRLNKMTLEVSND